MTEYEEIRTFACHEVTLNPFVTTSHISKQVVNIEAVNVNTVSLNYESHTSFTPNLIPSLSYILHLIVVKPIPNMRLKTGPATHPVIASSPKPFLLIEIEARASPTELPHERRVSPRSATLMPETISKRVKMSTIKFASM